MLSGTTIYREIGDFFAYLVVATLAFAVGEPAARARRKKREDSAAAA